MVEAVHGVGFRELGLHALEFVSDGFADEFGTVEVQLWKQGVDLVNHRFGEINDDLLAGSGGFSIRGLFGHGGCFAFPLCLN
jgi:hypothetical protein